MSTRTIAVVGATGRQGGGVVAALAGRPGWKARALTRNPSAYQGPAEEVALADLTRPETLGLAFAGADGVFLVTNFWEQASMTEVEQARAAISAARAAGVGHLVWSTLPDVHAISDGAFAVPHFTGKAQVDADARAAGFPHLTFVEAPFFFQNLTSGFAPEVKPDGTKVWSLPLDPAARALHAGDAADVGKVVVGAFERPEKVGQGQHLAAAADLHAFDDFLAALRALGHKAEYVRVPGAAYSARHPGAAEVVAMCRFIETFTYFGPDAADKLARGRAVATEPMTPFPDWARRAMPVTAL